VHCSTNLPPPLNVLIIYNMHEGSSNLHQQCLHHGRRSVSLLADRPTAHFCRCRLSPSPSFCPYLSPDLPTCVGLHDKSLPPTTSWAQTMDVLHFWCLALGYFAHYKIVHDGQNRWTKNTTSARRSTLVGETSWYDSFDPCIFTSCLCHHLASCSCWRFDVVEYTCTLSWRKQVCISG